MGPGEPKPMFKRILTQQGLPHEWDIRKKLRTFARDQQNGNNIFHFINNYD